MSLIEPSSTVYFAFRHHSTGVASGTWTKTLLKNNVVQAQAITVTETASGLYTGSFSADSSDGAYWHLDVLYDGEGYEETFRASGAATKARKALTNKLDISSGDYTIYDDDGTTPLFTGSVTDTTRTPD